MTYDEFVASMLPHCHCGCGSTGCADRPCDGVLAGGLCDTMQCHCDDYDQAAEDELDYQDENNA